MKKNFENLMKDNGFGEEEKGEGLKEVEEELTDKEIEARVDIFIKTVEHMNKEEKARIKAISLNLNLKYHSGCSSWELIQSFNEEAKKVLKR